MNNHIIFGGAGFFGFFLAQKLSENKENKIYIIDDLSRGKFDKDLKILINKKEYIFLKVDLTNFKKILEKLRLIIFIISIILPQ